ncbi:MULTISPECIES: type II secretion system minor pseudopilin GspK [unclassified Hahella]|uniref:type II secretion system minor pseudopilin GspK n=1 Tax=unclassified Hahella TaxID=2624107 RepID=UPI0020A6A499|nr:MULTISPECIES: type II secretion system minor pseudopilin GspK [unclassified Hahella]MDG9671020.1 type II secretion system minor pseudopilin GspK [Hahella sp. CR1]
MAALQVVVAAVTIPVAINPIPMVAATQVAVVVSGGNRGLRKQSGIAALIVIFIVALVMVLVAGLFNIHYLDIRRTSNILEQDQAKMYALAAETYARTILREDFAQDKKANKMVDHEVDNTDEPWGQYAIQIPIDTNVGIQGQIDDLMGRFNINSLVTNKNGASAVNKEAVQQFERLLSSLKDINPDVTAEKFVDWIDVDDQIYQLKGAEEETYLLKKPPYRAANSYFNDISEFWLIDGMDAATYKELKKFVAILPNSSGMLNVNTAPAEVLMAYIPGLDKQTADKIVDIRKEEGHFADVNQFLSLAELAGKKEIPKKLFRVNSEYFQATLRAIFNERTTRLISIIHRDAEEGNTSVLRRDFGKKEDITKEVYVPK